MNTGSSKWQAVRRSRLFLVVALIGLVIGLVLMSINLYGLTQQIRKPGLGVTDQEQLRFVPSEVWSYEQSMTAIEQLDTSLPVSDLVGEANAVVNQSLVHVEWLKVNPLEYRQLVPIWENYFVWAVGKFSGLPQFERYHFANYKRSIRRGIGICGDASMILSSILDNQGIENRIVSFGGHVIVEYLDEGGNSYLVDPDFGVELNGSLQHLVETPSNFRGAYLEAGYAPREVDDLFEAYRTPFALYDDTYHFVTKRYIFEEVSYVLKWIFPLLLLIVCGAYLFLRNKALKHD